MRVKLDVDSGGGLSHMLAGWDQGTQRTPAFHLADLAVHLTGFEESFEVLASDMSLSHFANIIESSMGRRVASAP